MEEFESKRPPRKKLEMGTYYDIIAGLLYVALAFYLYSSPPGGISSDVIEVVLVIFGIYGLFRIGRGVYRVSKK